LPHGNVTVERTPRKVEEIVLDGNSLASLSTSEAPQIAYDRRPASALTAEFQTARNAHFTKQSRVDASVHGESGDSSSLANRGRESSWPGIRLIQLQCGFRFSDRVTIANLDLGPGSCRSVRRRFAMRWQFSSNRNH
jgi:hypothetical protein